MSGIVAIAGLAGMISKQVTDKLREVFNNFSQTDDKCANERRIDKAN